MANDGGWTGHWWQPHKNNPGVGWARTMKLLNNNENYSDDGKYYINVELIRNHNNSKDKM